VEQVRNSPAIRSWRRRRECAINPRLTRRATAAARWRNCGWRGGAISCCGLGFGIFLAVALSTAIYTTYVMRTLRSEAEQNLRERAERLAAVLSQALARPLFDINSAAVSSVVDAPAPRRKCWCCACWDQTARSWPVMFRR
jgi:hypothetical protein